MPLEPGDNPEAISHNIHEMLGSGHPKKQAVAAALHEAKDAQTFGKRDAKRLLEEHAVGGEGLKKYAKGAGISVSEAIKELQSIAGTWDALASAAAAYRASGAHATDHNGYSLYSSSVGVDAWRGDQYIGTFRDEATAKKSLDASDYRYRDKKGRIWETDDEPTDTSARWKTTWGGGETFKGSERELKEWLNSGGPGGDASPLGDSLARMSDAVKPTREMTQEELEKELAETKPTKTRREALNTALSEKKTFGDAISQMCDAVGLDASSLSEYALVDLTEMLEDYHNGDKGAVLKLAKKKGWDEKKTVAMIRRELNG